MLYDFFYLNQVKTDKEANFFQSIDAIQTGGKTRSDVLRDIILERFGIESLTYKEYTLCRTLDDRSNKKMPDTIFFCIPKHYHIADQIMDVVHERRICGGPDKGVRLILYEHFGLRHPWKQKKVFEEVSKPLSL